tara:strand:+ start:511 stop:984 length:474 start_codon:yes stop_codon:yes gene_type:complete
MYVEAKKTFKKDRSEILDAIRLPNNLENYHPFCKENKVEKWPGKGSIDYVKYLNGLKYRRDFVKWDESGYVLDIGVESKVARVKWLVEGNSTQSSLKITINPKLPYKNKIIRTIMWHIYIKYRLQIYINNVVEGFADYIDTKERVPMNKYGKHPWFS